MGLSGGVFINLPGMMFKTMMGRGGNVHLEKMIETLCPLIKLTKQPAARGLAFINSHAH